MCSQQDVTADLAAVSLLLAQTRLRVSRVFLM